MDETAWTVLPAAQRGESKELAPHCSPHSLNKGSHWGWALDGISVARRKRNPRSGSL